MISTIIFIIVWHCIFKLIISLFLATLSHLVRRQNFLKNFRFRNEIVYWDCRTYCYHLICKQIVKSVITVTVNSGNDFEDTNGSIRNSYRLCGKNVSRKHLLLEMRISSHLCTLDSFKVVGKRHSQNCTIWISINTMNHRMKRMKRELPHSRPFFGR